MDSRYRYYRYSKKCRILWLASIVELFIRRARLITQRKLSLLLAEITCVKIDSSQKEEVVRKQIHQYIESKSWEAVIACLSPLEQRIVVSLSRRDHAVRGAIAIECLSEPATTNAMIARLVKAGLIKLVKTTAAGERLGIADEGFKKHCLTLDRSVIWCGVVDELNNQIYQFLVTRFEALVDLGLIVGDGHHFAQKATAEIKAELDERWKTKL
jgi:hypothetical protein